jgi:hypothetical protein
MNELPKLIAISGWKGSGKDTAGLHLMAEYKYRPISFAYELKNMVAKLYEVHRFWMDDRDKKDMPLLHMPAIPTDPFSETIHHMLRDELKSGYWTPRALCILEGSIKRSVYGNYWVKKVVEIILKDPDNNYVITDMRYANEADTLKLMIPSTLTVRVERPGHIITTQDPSERDLDSYRFDRVVRNEGTIPDFYRNIDLLIRGDLK